MADKLKPCPFCRGIPKFLKGGNTNWIECHPCIGSVSAKYYKAWDSAVKAWNHRPIEDAQANLIREMGETLEFYANLENWKWKANPTDRNNILDCGSEVQRDFSKRAKAALEKYKLWEKENG